MVLSFGILCILVFKCDSTYKIAEAILAQITRFEFKSTERETGIPTVFAELSSQIIQQPIQFTVAGFYVISKTFLASVNAEKKIPLDPTA